MSDDFIIPYQRQSHHLRPSSSPLPHPSFHQGVDHLLLVDEVRCLADEGHERGEVIGPIIEQLARVLALTEAHQACRAVDAGKNGLLGHQFGEKVLRLLQIEWHGEGDNTLHGCWEDKGHCI